MSFTLQPKQLVLAKIKGFPDWPAIVVPVDQIPTKLKTAKNAKFLDNYLENDHVCVKFYYDDQYSWTNMASIKPLNDQIVDDYLISVGEMNGGDGDIAASSGKRGGRKKRITEAYLKVKQVPVDEFLEWGSWGKPVAPEPELEFEQEEATPEAETQEENKTKSRRKRNASAKAEPAKKKQKTGKKVSAKSGSKTVKKPAKKNAKSKKGAKENSETPDSVFDDEEFIINDEAEGDDDYISSLDESVSNDDEEDEDDLVDEEEDDEGEGEEESEESEDEQETNQGAILENGEEIWGLDTTKAKDLNVNFKEIPSASALAVEVKEMTAWCRELRMELQKLIFPLKKQKQGEKIKKETENGDANGKEAAAASLNGSNKEGPETEEESKAETESEEKEKEKEEDEKEEGKDQQESVEERVIDYKKINKAIDSLIAPLLSADLSKSILKATGLMKLISIILKKPEFQTPTVRKLNKWWMDNFHFKLEVDYHWGDDFTIEMHLQEEAERKAREEERKRRRKEERKSHSVAATPEVDEVSSPVKTET